MKLKINNVIDIMTMCEQLFTGSALYKKMTNKIQQPITVWSNELRIYKR